MYVSPPPHVYYSPGAPSAALITHFLHLSLPPHPAFRRRRLFSHPPFLRSHSKYPSLDPRDATLNVILVELLSSRHNTLCCTLYILDITVFRTYLNPLNDAYILRY